MQRTSNELHQIFETLNDEVKTRLVQDFLTTEIIYEIMLLIMAHTSFKSSIKTL